MREGAQSSPDTSSPPPLGDGEGEGAGEGTGGGGEVGDVVGSSEPSVGGADGVSLGSGFGLVVGSGSPPGCGPWPFPPDGFGCPVFGTDGAAAGATGTLVVLVPEDPTEVPLPCFDGWTAA